MAIASSFTRFLNHTQLRATVGRTPLDGWSARRRDLYLTTHTTEKHPFRRWDGTHDRSWRAAVNLRLRPCGYWSRQVRFNTHAKYSWTRLYTYIYIYVCFVFLKILRADTQLILFYFKVDHNVIVIRIVRLEVPQKRKVHPKTCYEDTEGEYACRSTPYFTSAIDVGGWLMSHTGRFTHGNRQVPTVYDTSTIHCTVQFSSQFRLLNVSLTLHSNLTLFSSVAPS
jgi:hypothetical protein